MEHNIERTFGRVLSALAGITLIGGISLGRTELYLFAFTIGFFSMILIEDSYKLEIEDLKKEEEDEQ